MGKRPSGRPCKKGQTWKLAILLGTEPRPDLTIVIARKMEWRRVVWCEVRLRDITHKVRG